MAAFPPSVPNWDNLAVLHRHTLPPRPHFFIYDSEDAALRRDTTAARAQLLSGTWKFQLAQTPLEGAVDFHAPGHDLAGFVDISVPGMWQLQGHGRRPQYTNIQYPWPVDPPHVPLEDNECGRYVTRFSVSPDWPANAQLRLRFEGVDAAFSVWLNGHKIGYSQGSRNPSEFDVTGQVERAGPNVLAVEVYQRCDGSYIEDQDQWWLSGIFRDVYLHAFPAVHPLDYTVETDFDDGYVDAVLRVTVAMSAATDVALKLLDADGRTVAAATQPFVAGTPATFEIPVAAPHKWTAETPYLYDLVLDFGAVVAQRVGFRKTELRADDGVFRINGQPVKFRGANRHEHHPDSGRTVPYEFLRQDLLLMKAHGLNAVRTSHQINDVRLYDLADELGLWILDEADLECHGFDEIGLDDPAAPLSDNPAWEAAYVDRAVQMVQRDKNRTCVVIWSLGNESFYGRNHQAMYDAIRRLDRTRLIHYEGDKDALTSDVYSRMYPPVETVVDMAEGVCVAKNKPLLLCEFIHAMGNGPGAIQEYIDAFYQHPRLMGGFIWEWANHGLRTHKDGHEFMAYGGDFGDVPNDYNFVMDGCLFSNHTPAPGLLAYAKAIEPVQTLSLQDHRVVTVANRYDFLSLDHLTCRWDIVADGLTVSGGPVAIPVGIRPHTTAELTIDGLAAALATVADREAYLHLSFHQTEATAWAPADHLIAFGELPLTPPPLSLAALWAQPPSTPGRPTVVQTDATRLTVTSASGASVWGFDLARGTLVSWKRQRQGQEGLVEVLSAPLTLDFYRALTDNDREIHGREWLERRLHQTRHHVRHVSWATTKDDGVEVTVQGRVAPPVLAWGVDVTWTFSFVDDRLLLRLRGHPHGAWLPTFFARVGVTLGLATDDDSEVAWFGRGPGESYRDKKHSQAMGAWSASVDDLFVDYEFPQECGNRTDVRHVELRDPQTKQRLLRAQFGRLDGASFSALRYATADLDACTHPYELHARRRPDTLVRLDWMHHGLGSGSCGPPTTPAYQLKAEDFDVSVLLD